VFVLFLYFPRYCDWEEWLKNYFQNKDVRTKSLRKSIEIKIHIIMIKNEENITVNCHEMKRESSLNSLD